MTKKYLVLAIILSAILNLEGLVAKNGQTVREDVYDPTAGFIDDMNIRSISFRTMIHYKDLPSTEAGVKYQTKMVRIRGRPFRVIFDCWNHFSGKWWCGPYLEQLTMEDNTSRRPWKVKFRVEFLTTNPKKKKVHDLDYTIYWNSIQFKPIRGSCNSHFDIIKGSDLTDPKNGYVEHPENLRFMLDITITVDEYGS